MTGEQSGIVYPKCCRECAVCVGMEGNQHMHTGVGTQVQLRAAPLVHRVYRRQGIDLVCLAIVLYQHQEKIIQLFQGCISTPPESKPRGIDANRHVDPLENFCLGIVMPAQPGIVGAITSR